MKNAPPDAIPPEEWWLTPAELDFVRARHPTNRLSFALLLLFFRQHCRFPHQLSDINPVKTEVVARQIGLSDDGPQAIALSHRTLERYRSEIRDWFGFRKALDADMFIATLQAEMKEALRTLDRGLPNNRLVRIGEAQGGRITVTPFDPLPEPPNVVALKAEIAATWPMTGLLDMIKETESLRSVSAPPRPRPSSGALSRTTFGIRPTRLSPNWERR